MTIDKAKRKAIGQPDLREVVELHAQASKKLGLLQEEYQALIDAGEKVSAKAALQRVEKIQTVIRAIEARVKQSPDS
jgi:Zn-dependent M32 family carboxypeptidase